MATDFKAKILEELDTLRKADIARKQVFPARAYKTAMEAIQAIPGPIVSVDNVKGVKGVGAKILLKIEEIISTGSLRAATEARAELPLNALDALQGVHGIGPVKARELIDSGLTTIEQLRAASAANAKLLTTAQKLGLKYYEDSQQRIPRAEMAEHENTILTGLDVRFEGTIVGSYRRGAESSGDIDVLLTLPDELTAEEQGELFVEMVSLFKEADYIVDTLSSGSTKFLGYCRVDEEHPVRRLDLLMIPQSEYACAILYFTGSQQFNVAFRSYALDKGYTLNEHRLQATKAGVHPVPAFTKEKDIFDFLGLQYVEPTMRRGAADIVPV